ncbi:hypothetical protein BDL97_09G009800 [Sphagnum fallax]|nr:hypothetical protein BDL97_09G009800 [Sphagnum fallax]
MLLGSISNTMLTPLAEVLTRLIMEFAQTAFAVKDVLIEKETFKELARYLERIRPILKEMSEKNVKDTPEKTMQQGLVSLEGQIKKARSLISMCTSKSRIYLLVNCRMVVKEIQDITREIGQCLSSIPMATLGLSIETLANTAQLQRDMQQVQFKAAVAEEAIMEKIETGIRDHRIDSEWANGLLLQIAQAVGVPVDPISLRQELESFKREKEEAQLRKSQAEAMQLHQIIELLVQADAATSEREKDSMYQIKKSAGGNHLPALQSFYCPITQEVMQEPVEIASGQTFERSAIEKWFSAGHHTCPTTKVELDNLEIKLNLALRQSIQEWRERNTASSIAAMKPKLLSGNEEEVSSALRELLSLCEERCLHKYWIAAEGLIPVLVKLLQSGQRRIRKETLATLRSLAVDNIGNKEKIAEAGGIKQVVRSLARDVGEGQQAVALLLELSEAPNVCEQIGKTQGCILLLVTMLNSENLHAIEDARKLLEHLSNNDQNVVQMAEANHFSPLILRLSEGSDMTKVLMASALSRMGLTETSKAALAQQGAIPPLVKMICYGKLEAKAAALGALQNLSTLPENREPMIEAGVIAPLLQLLFSVTSVVMSLKEHAAATLANLTMASTTAKTNINDMFGNILEPDETIFQLLSLLNLAGPVIQGHLLRALLGMSSLPSARDVREKMREGGAIQLLLPFCEVPDNEVRIHAIKLLNCLSGDGAGKELADHLGLTYLKALVKILVDSNGDAEKAAVLGIIQNTPVSDTHVTQLLLQAEALPVIVSLLKIKGAKSGPSASQNMLVESAAGALLRFTVSDNLRLQQMTANLDVIPILVQLLQTVLADAICPLVLALEEKGDSADEAALDALSTLLNEEHKLENGVQVIAEAGGIKQIIRLLTVGSVGAKEKAVWMLEKIFRVEKYKTEYGSTAQMPLIDMTQKGTNTTKPLAAKILAHLNILHNQSSYF